MFQAILDPRRPDEVSEDGVGFRSVHVALLCEREGDSVIEGTEGGNLFVRARFYEEDGGGERSAKRDDARRCERERKKERREDGP